MVETQDNAPLKVTEYFRWEETFVNCELPGWLWGYGFHDDDDEAVLPPRLCEIEEVNKRSI